MLLLSCSLSSRCLPLIYVFLKTRPRGSYRIQFSRDSLSSDTITLPRLAHLRPPRRYFHRKRADSRKCIGRRVHTRLRRNTPCLENATIVEAFARLMLFPWIDRSLTETAEARTGCSTKEIERSCGWTSDDLSLWWVWCFRFSWDLFCRCHWWRVFYGFIEVLLMV